MPTNTPPIEDPTPGGPVDPPEGTEPSGEPTPQQLFSSAITTLEIEVDYQTGGAPYTGSAGSRHPDLWVIVRDNVTALAADKTQIIPNALADMEELTDVTGEDFTVLDILTIAQSHRGRMSAGATATFYVVFLAGYFNDGARQENVLGVSIGDTHVIAMFKPVIASTGGGLLTPPNTPKFVEQATLVHELGHAVGLVDNGLPMQTAHIDTAHGHHCDNEDCTMYFANEGAGTVGNLITSFIAGNDNVLFDQHCLDDAHMVD